MVNGTFTGFPLISDRDEFERLLKSYKRSFSRASEIASTVDWNVKYAYYKPHPPTEEELRFFNIALEELKKEFELYRLLLKEKHPEELNTLAKRLEWIEEEFYTYPFSDRLKFFLTRLEFLRYLLRKITQNV